ncbi:hypothetical protein SAMN06297251_13818 [Fulvimarina manganoxydans]|uniref:Polysaccharide deacetylase n=1 Tax=Fulvimarina manganoxydans TaxID=937218 RepID=A0A1W2EVH6_9HYPH|nr:polysaccharide deacetylase family protein [Fulvimarina manganoxydans]SMD13697.1 hypothetical protein SAMN06297251_13818 [Fulvimarina manganoxydans]
MTSLPRSRARLDALEAQGRTIAFWWRDDDARAPSLALDRLLALQSEAAVPLALAVIPDGLDQALALGLHDLPVSVLLHGHAHANHAPPDEKRAEFGDHRPLEAMTAELIEGRDKLCAMFGARFLPVFVPPWNRIGADVRRQLTSLGLPVLSVYGPVRGDEPREINTHLDIMDWRAMAGLSLDVLDETLAAEIKRRSGEDGKAREPIGLLTHHLQHDEAAWAGLAALLALLAHHPAATWPSLDHLLSADTSGQAGPLPTVQEKA